MQIICYNFIILQNIQISLQFQKLWMLKARVSFCTIGRIKIHSLRFAVFLFFPFRIQLKTPECRYRMTLQFPAKKQLLSCGKFSWCLRRNISYGRNIRLSLKSWPNCWSTIFLGRIFEPSLDRQVRGMCQRLRKSRKTCSPSWVGCATAWTYSAGCWSVLWDFAPLW